MQTVRDPVLGRVITPSNVIPEVFGEAISYEDKLIALLKWILAQGYITPDQFAALKAELDQLKTDFDKFKESGFEDYYKAQLEAWINAHFADILTEGIKSVVFFGLTLDGYFTAYIPESWSEIIFDTGMVYGTDEYGRLILSYPDSQLASPTLQPAINR